MPRTVLLKAPAVVEVEEEDDDGDDDDDFFGDEGDEVYIEDVRSGEAEDLIFRFTADGEPKPWAVKPHLRTMIEEVQAGRAILLDVREQPAWAKAHLAMATHCPFTALEALPLPSDLPLPARKDTPIYVHSAFADEGKLGVKAALLLRKMGYTKASHLVESYEALCAQLNL
jgi:rhodanese-related sulfurtransferase